MRSDPIQGVLAGAALLEQGNGGAGEGGIEIR